VVAKACLGVSHPPLAANAVPARQHRQKPRRDIALKCAVDMTSCSDFRFERASKNSNGQLNPQNLVGAAFSHRAAFRRQIEHASSPAGREIVPPIDQTVKLSVD
jgi:hypothetical protein